MEIILNFTYEKIFFIKKYMFIPRIMLKFTIMGCSCADTPHFAVRKESVGVVWGEITALANFIKNSLISDICRY